LIRYFWWYSSGTKKFPEWYDSVTTFAFQSPDASTVLMTSSAVVLLLALR